MYGRRNKLTDIWNYIPMSKSEFRALPEANKATILTKAREDMATAQARRKAEIAAEKAAKDKTARTCQICARRIFAETGVIAHHGYERPGDGYQTESCRGARRLPYEADHVALDEEIAWTADRLMGAKDLLRQMREERVDFSFQWVDQEERRKRPGSQFAGFRYMRGITRDNWDTLKADPANKEAFRQCCSYTFDQLKERTCEEQEDKVETISQYLKRQTLRRAEWVHKESWDEVAKSWSII